MAQLQLIKQSSGILIPATPETSDFLHSKCKLGAVLEGEFRRVRNAALHRKYFSLLNLGFEYWEPAGGAITPSEKHIVSRYADYLAQRVGNGDILASYAEEFFCDLSARRTSNITACKSFDAYREWVIVCAGYYDVVFLPDGSQRKRPKSISFANMDDTAFVPLYTETLNVLWRFILHRSFSNQREAENAAAQLMSFGG
ncbi:DUF1367 family protein [Leclercia adecarboxylata]|uniref:DUF1367 domain-containing protein n=1 Tax=Leclercia adecarboxylata TaxID=83655 RepID=A0A855ESM8_9ENTR|nr:DUF1367 family protein [Leclercia adecarboxylata]KFC98272.1 hypothetical protein GLAD_00560 [Leclercia adecarboxylata ATCC 23216 = NBRC 102595]PHH04804.1 DUF1367 domain-containing protein [Leclercia adecarboxylata]UBH68586.1 DUF1367 family protein [Leclercia adecarboxylata]SPX63826.1 Protein of uncharacterised function (DUF1367) [Leclercia adecarboxylata]STX23016.1 Protein of uncharacterised function (DUF1367) [Leclercia adecarboxylata]